MEHEDSINFPEISGVQYPPSIRTIDQIDAWIEEDYKLFFDRESYDAQKKRNSVNVPFIFKAEYLSIQELKKLKV